ncbi:MAG: hypothetical protein R2822_28305 [Spirosomataceae bacterium]
MDGQIPRFTYNDYHYRNVYLRGNFKQKIFKGSVIVKDTNLLADVDGIFNFSKDKYAYHAEGVYPTC